MASFDYSRSLKTATRLIGRFGRPATLRRVPTGGEAHDPTPGAPVDTPCTVVVNNYEKGEIDGTRILATDLKVLMAVPAEAPTPSHQLFLTGEAKPYTIVEPVKPLAPGPTVLLFEVQARR